MTVLRVCYRKNVRFDENYYLTKHLPLVGRIMQPYDVKAVEVMRVTATPDGSAPVYQMMFSAHFESVAAATRALQSAEFGQALADIPNYYDGAPDVMIGELIGA